MSTIVDDFEKQHLRNIDCVGEVVKCQHIFSFLPVPQNSGSDNGNTSLLFGATASEIPNFTRCGAASPKIDLPKTSSLSDIAGCYSPKAELRKRFRIKYDVLRKGVANNNITLNPSQ